MVGFENYCATGSKDVLNELSTNGNSFRILHKFFSQKNASAYCLLNILLSNSKPDFKSDHPATNGIQNYNQIINGTDTSLIADVCFLMKKHNVFVEICNSLDSDIKKLKGWGLILKNMVSNDKLIGCINSQNFIKNHKFYKEHLNQEFGEEKINYYEKLVKFSGGRDLSEVLCDRGISIEFGYAYYLLLEEDGINSKILEKKLEQNLKSIKESDWLDLLCNELRSFTLLDVVIEMQKLGYKEFLDHHFVEALCKHAKALIYEKCKIDYLQEDWQSFLSSLKPLEKDRFRERLLNLVVDEGRSIVELLKIYSYDLEVIVDKSDKPTKIKFVHNVCLKISETGKVEEKIWLLNLFKEQKDLIENANEEDRKLLANRLESFLKEEHIKEPTEDSEEETLDKNTIENVAEQLNITLIEESVSDVDSDDNESGDQDPDPEAELTSV